MPANSCETSLLLRLDSHSYYYYFTFRQWFRKKDMLKLWNLHEFAVGTPMFKLISRSNCALESYNRRLNNKFAQRHPNLNAFVAGLNEEANDQVRRLNEIVNEQSLPPAYDDIPFPVIPDEYEGWQYEGLPYISLSGEPVSAAAAAPASPVVPAAPASPVVATRKSSRARKGPKVYDV